MDKRQVPLVTYHAGDQVGTISLKAFAAFTGIPESTLSGAKHRGHINGAYGKIRIDQAFLNWLPNYHPQQKTAQGIRWTRVVDCYMQWEERLDEAEARHAEEEARLDSISRRMVDEGERPYVKGLNWGEAARRLLDSILSPI